MKLAIIALFILFSISISHGQIYHPLIRSDVHFYTMNKDRNKLCYYNGGGRLFFQGDTLINGTTYSKIKVYPIFSFFGIPYCPPYYIDTTESYTYNNFLREDTVEKKVYIFQASFQAEELLYDFNLVSGDTLNSLGSRMNKHMVVDSVSTVTLLNGNVRDIYYLNNGEYYIESIGGSQGVLGPLSYGSEIGAEITCVVEHSIIIWGEGTTLCNNLISLSQPYTNDRVIIEPLIADDYVKITIPNCQQGKISIFDTNTNLILEKEFTKRKTVINISNLQSASYHVIIFDNRNPIASGQFIIRR